MSKNITEARQVLRDSGAFLAELDVLASIERCRVAVDRMFADEFLPGQVMGRGTVHSDHCLVRPEHGPRYHQCIPPQRIDVQFLHGMNRIYEEGSREGYYVHDVAYLNAYGNVPATVHNMEIFYEGVADGVINPQPDSDSDRYYWMLSLLASFFVCLHAMHGHECNVHVLDWWSESE